MQRERGVPAELEPVAGVCRFCGCTDERACRGGCWWADATRTVCSACMEDQWRESHPLLAHPLSGIWVLVLLIALLLWAVW